MSSKIVQRPILIKKHCNFQDQINQLVQKQAVKCKIKVRQQEDRR